MNWACTAPASISATVAYCRHTTRCRARSSRHPRARTNILELLESDPKDPGVLVDGKKRFRLSYGHLDNTYSEGNKLHYWDIPYDVNGDGQYTANENVANAYFSHLYVYKDLKGTNPKGTSADKEKLFVGIQIPVPRDNGPAGAAVPSPMKGGYLHYTGEKGTIVFTKSPVLDNVPIVLTNPGIWDALGLPLTPFNDRSAKQDPLTLTEADIQPFQEAWVSLVDEKTGAPVIDSHSGKPITFVGTSPIDIPNCANCHSNKTANGEKFNLYKQEREFWKGLGASDWIANLKATSVSILQMHDDRTGTDFLKNYNPNSRSLDNRLGRDPVLCQKCHADNVIGVLMSKTYKDPKTGADMTISPLTQAIHTVHQTDGSIARLARPYWVVPGLPPGTPPGRQDGQLSDHAGRQECLCAWRQPRRLGRMLCRPRCPCQPEHAARWHRFAGAPECHWPMVAGQRFRDRQR